MFCLLINNNCFCNYGQNNSKEKGVNLYTLVKMITDKNINMLIDMALINDDKNVLIKAIQKFDIVNYIIMCKIIKIK